MTPHPCRPVAVLIAGLILVLAGCGKSGPQNDGEPPTGEKGKAPARPGGTGPTPQPGGPPAPAAPGEVKPQDPSQIAAEAFVKDLRAGAIPPDLLNRLTPSFLKVIGKPVLSPADRSRGYSTSAAEGWLRRAGAALAGVAPPAGYAGPGVAVFAGSFNNPSVADGRVLLRLVPAEGGWKVDWVQLGAAKANDPPKPVGPDEAFQDFAVQSFLDALTGDESITRDDRIPLVAASLSPGLRNAWAEPFAQDKDRGYDYNPARIGQRMDEYGGGATAYTRTRTGTDQYKVEIIKDGKPRAYTLKLVTGEAPGVWLVDGFATQS